MSKKLKTALDKALKNYIYKFEVIHGVEFESAMNDDLMDVLCFGEYYFNMSDIIYDVDNKLPIRLIFEWHDACTDAHYKGKNQINLQSYAKGLRHE
jgi:hypothetical protein